jgi:hypothetical protein
MTRYGAEIERRAVPMPERTDRRPELRQKAREVLSRLSPEERERLIIKCWMAHDARWFMAVAREFGVEAANRLNRVAAHEEGNAEARRLVRALALPPVATAEDYLAVQEIIIGLLGPELFDYQVVEIDDRTFELRIQRCFAHENVTRAGVADVYECGIPARVTGWLDALGLGYDVTPSPGKCAKAEGRECVYTFGLQSPRVA